MPLPMQDLIAMPAVYNMHNTHMLLQLGADVAVDYKTQDFVQMYRDNPFDAVIDLIGGRTITPYFLLPLVVPSTLA